MTRYIDAEKLIAEIKRQIEEEKNNLNEETSLYYGLRQQVRSTILRIIDSLRQEQPGTSKGKFVLPNSLYARTVDNKTIDVSYAPQSMDAVEYIKNDTVEQPEVDLVAELKHHLATTPKEQLEKEWKELEPWNNVGPTVQEFLYGKQPGMDVEKEIEDYAYSLPHSTTGSSAYVSDKRLPIARQFGIKHAWSFEYVMEIAMHSYELGQLEMRRRITNPEYNAKVVEQLKSEYPVRKEE